MIKKLILICLIGLLCMVGIPNPPWAYAGPILAQTETAPQESPMTQPNNPSKKDTTPSSETNQTPAKKTDSSNGSSTVNQRSQDKPFNPYNMEALKRFDAGDHRAK